MTTPVYEVRDLVKRYKQNAAPANDGLSFDICEGEIFGILGDNGAGKTTLIRQMVNLVLPTSGTITLYGKSLKHTPQLVSYMPQSGATLNLLTVREILYFTAHLRGLSRPDALRERDRLIELLGLGAVRDRVIPRLSGGEKRMVLLGTTLAASRPVMILDEPTNDLSPQNRRLVWDILRQINQAQGTTIVLVTHNAIEAERVIERVAILAHGKMIALGRPGQLKGELNQQLRLELVFAPDHPPALPPGCTPTQLAPGRWQVLIERDSVGQLLDTLTRLPGVEDFRLSTATLEDLYLSLAGGDHAKP